MTLTALFAASEADWPDYESALPTAFVARGLDVRLVRKTDTPEDIDYIIYAPNGPLRDFGPYINAKAVLSLWAGVESIVSNATLTQPLCRLVDPGLAEGMREWVVGHVLRYHLGLDQHIREQDGVWRENLIAPLARQRRIGILGLGELGRTCATALVSLGFSVSGWSNSAKSIDGVSAHSGDDGLRHVLERSDILVLLLPNTPATTDILNSDRLSWLPQGAFLINPGRGALIDDDALLSALDSGQIAHATLDVFRVEPLPAQHPFWAHPNVTVTPHIASATRPQTAAEVIAENIARGESGTPFLHQVNRQRGY